MPPLLCRILILRKICSEYVLNNEGQKLSSWWSPKVTRLQIFNTLLRQVYQYQQLSLDENDFHTKNDHILGIFKCKRMILLLRNYHSFQVQIVDTSLFLKTPCVELEVSTSKTQKTEFYQAQGANFVTFFSNLGLFKAKSRSNLPLYRL